MAAPTRRKVLKSSGVVAAAMALGSLPEHAAAAVKGAASNGVFGFGVASGDPTATEVLLWTRITPTPAAVPGSGLGPRTSVRWELAANSRFTSVLQSGTVLSDPASDQRVALGGLSRGRGLGVCGEAPAQTRHPRGARSPARWGTSSNSSYQPRDTI